MKNPYLVCSDRELRALPTQWMRAERWTKVGSLLYDPEFLDAKVKQLGIDELLQDYAAALRLLPKEDSTRERLANTNRVLDRETHRLRDWSPNELPSFFLQQIRNCSLELGYGDLLDRTDEQLAAW